MTIRQTLASRREDLQTRGRQIIDRATAERRDLNDVEDREYREILEDLSHIAQREDQLSEQERMYSETSPTLRSLAPNTHEAHSPADRAAVDHLRSILIENNPRPLTVKGDVRRVSRPGVEQRDILKTNPAGFQARSFYEQIITAMMDSCAVISAGATVITTENGETLAVPRSDPMSAGIVAEGAAIPKADPGLGTVELGAHKYATLVQASNEALSDAGADLQGYLATQTGEALGRALGAHLINGTGVGQPKGVLTSATVGVSTPKADLGSQANPGEGTDLLNNLHGSLVDGYAQSPACAFITRNATLAAVRNLKTSSGDPVGSSYVAAPPAPFLTDGAMPLMSAGKRSILLGDWSRYFVRMVNGIRFERSDEYAFGNDLVTFRAIIRADGALIDQNAVKALAHA